jgi:uncharacterized protein (DUF2141 family)
MKQYKLLFLFVLLCSFSAHAADLAVNIENITQTKAPIICALFDSADGFPMKRKSAISSVTAELEGDNAICTFKDIPAKQIAISVLEDLNNNGKVDTTFVGFPKEPWAVSNNAPAHTFGPPTFAEAAIDGASISNINIKLIKP